MNASPSRINIPKHNRFIARHGERVKHAIAIKCPYGFSDDPNRHDIRCQHCGGKGYIWIEEKTIIAGVTDVHEQKQLVQLGLAIPGDAILMPRTFERPITDWDRITFTWPMPYEGELITRNEDTSKPDKLYYEPGVYRGKKSYECHAVDMNAAIPATSFSYIGKYLEGVDYTIAHRTLSWLPNRGPSPGDQYSIKYQALSEWIVFAPPTPRYERGVNLGQRVVLRKKHLVNWEVI